MFVKKKMENIQSFKLVDGSYTPKDAEEILMALISDKIKFHQGNIFSINERNCEGDIEHSEKRIAELKAEKVRVRTMLRNIEDQDMKIAISSDVNIIIEENIAVV